MLPNISPNIRLGHMSMLVLNYNKWNNKTQSSHINLIMVNDFTAQVKFVRR